MAAKLNKTRIRDTKLVVIASFLIILFSKQIIDDDFTDGEPAEFIGLLLVSLCAVGRIYCTAFLGGFKNWGVIDYGPFSVCRNPLYLCSFIGVVGISLMATNIAVLLIMPIGFLLIYISLIKREEVYLENKFGDEYLKYKRKTPRLIPNFKLYHAPKTVEMTPKTMLRGFGDSLMWFCAYPLIELIEYLQDDNILKPLIYIKI